RRRNDTGGAMNRLRIALMIAVMCATVGCSFNLGPKPESATAQGSSSPAETVYRNSDVYTQESRTLSGLATLETRINDYIKGEGKIPDKLEELIPRYLAEIPTVELGQPK